MKTTAHPKLANPTRMARIAGVSRRWLIHQAKAGLLPCVIAGTEIVFCEPSVLAALAAMAGLSKADREQIEANRLAILAAQEVAAEVNAAPADQRAALLEAGRAKVQAGPQPKPIRLPAAINRDTDEYRCNLIDYAAVLADGIERQHPQLQLTFHDVLDPRGELDQPTDEAHQ